MRSNKKISLIEQPLSRIDWFIFIFFAVVSFFTFQQWDILHTGGSSFAYLNGHIWDFYDYNKTYMQGNNYLPSTYILFAIWNIPIRLLGLVTVPTSNVSTIVLMWYKLLPVSVYMISSLLIYKIGLEMGFDYKKSKLCAFVFLTTPIGFFSQFIFGQYDIFTVFFVLLGFYYYLKNDNKKFIIFFAIAITFKYFALLIFIPLLLLRVKNVWKIIWNTLCTAIPFLLEVGFYIHSVAFRKGVFGFGATGYLLQASIETSFFQIRLFILGWILTCAWAYFIKSENKKDEIKWTLYFCNITIFLIFGLSMWHPQWLLFAVPFWVLSTFINKKPDIFFLIDILMMFFFIGFTVNVWTNHVDQNLFNLGILKEYTTNIIGTSFTMSDLFIIKDKSLWFSFFSALLLVNTVFKHPKFCLENFYENIDKHWNLIRARFTIGISIFLIPAFISFAACFILPKPIFTVPTQNLTIVNPITDGRQVEQSFIATANNISKVKVQIGTYVRKNNSSLEMYISDMESNQVIYTAKIDVPNLVDNEFAEIKVPDIAIKKGNKYIIGFKAKNTRATDFITIYRTESNLNESAGYAIVDGQKQDYNLNVQVFGK